jgi:multiple antibiotic resistance protein
MLDLFISTFATLFVVIDPVGCAPIFAGLTAGHPPRHAAATAIRASVIATCILFTFALFGKALLGALHIELNAFRIAGGIMLFLIALDMVFEKRTQRREERVEKVLHAPQEHEDVSVFPMAMPMIAGPGSIATVMLMMGHATDRSSSLVVLAALAAVLALTAVALLAAHPLMRLLGSRVEAVVTRVLGVLLGALAVQYVVDGLRGAVLGG